MKLLNLKKMSLLAALIAGGWGITPAQAAGVSFTGAYTQNFDSALGASGTALPAGFATMTLAGNSGTYTAANPITTTAVAAAANSSSQALTVWNTGSGVADSASKLYNVGCWDGTSDRALGSDPASTVAAMVIQLSLVNNTGSSLLGVTFSYDDKCLTNGSGNITEASELPGYSFFYSLTGSTSPGDWFKAPALCLGNYREGTTLSSGAVAIVFPSPLASGSTLYFRWVDDKNVAGGPADQMNAIDNISISSTPAVPAVSIATPVNTQQFAPGSSITITAGAFENGGSIASVAFYAGSTLLGSVSTAPYTYTWQNAPAGGYALTAVATDANGVKTTSPAVNIAVDVPPTVSLNTPASGAVFTTPVTIALSATAASVGETIANVAFYQNGVFLANVTTPPYTYTWANPAANFYGLTAVTTDSLGVSTTSSVVNVTVTANLYALKTLQQIKTIFVIPLENHDWVQANPTGSPEQVSNNPAAPYVNSLATPGNSNAAQVSFATHYFSCAINGEHPSEPNYVWAEAGTDFAVRTDNDPATSSDNIFNCQHLTGQMTAAGVSWKTYQEDIQYSSSELVSVSGTTGSANIYNGTKDYSYAVKHNPMAFFTDTQNQNYYPLAQFFTDLNNNNVARYNWITPDQYDEMHSGLPSAFTYHGVQYASGTDQSAIASGDNFLSIVIPQIMATAAYKNNGVIIIWTDETESTDDTNTTLPFFIISPLAKGNAYASTLAYSHTSDLKTMDEIFKLAFQTNAIPSAELDAQNTGYNYPNGSSAVINDFADFFVSVTGTTLGSSVNPSGYKDSVTFAATVAGAGGTPTGTVQFSTNGVALGAPVALINGTATLGTTLLPPGSASVTAAYSGDANNQPSTNTLTQVVTNYPPVPATAVYQRSPGVPLLISTANLLTNVSDVDGYPISLVGVGTDGFNLTSTNGTTLVTNGAYILYTNSVTPNANDSFEYTVSDGQGDTAAGTVVIVVNSNVFGQTSPQLATSSTNATATFFGIPGFRYEVQRSTNLVAGMGWVPISTNVAPAGGVIQVQDGFLDLGIPIPPLPPNVYYRLVYQP